MRWKLTDKEVKKLALDFMKALRLCPVCGFGLQDEHSDKILIINIDEKTGFPRDFTCFTKKEASEFAETAITDDYRVGWIKSRTKIRKGQIEVQLDKIVA